MKAFRTIKIDPEVRELIREKAKKRQTYSQYILECIQFRQDHEDKEKKEGVSLRDEHLLSKPCANTGQQVT